MIICNLWIIKAAHSSDDFLLLIEVRYFFWAICHFELNLPRMKFDLPRPSDCLVMASRIPNRVEYEVAMIGRSLCHLNTMSSIALDKLAAVLVDLRMKFSSFFMTLLKFFFVLLSVHKRTWADFLLSEPQQGQFE